MTAITIEGVARSFGTVRAVDNVSIAVRDGEFFTLLGPSGCGKTTLLRMVAGFCELDAGRILFGEQRIDTLPPHKRNTGMVFQNYAVFPNLTVGGNVAYGLRARKVRADEMRERVARALKLVQLDGYTERWPHQLSGGQCDPAGLFRESARLWSDGAVRGGAERVVHRRQSERAVAAGQPAANRGRHAAAQRRADPDTVGAR